MDPATVGIACLILASSFGADPGDAPVACLPPMPYSAVVDMQLNWQTTFYPKGTVEYDQLLAQQK